LHALGVPLYALVQFEREEDEEILRKRIDTIIEKADAHQLKRIYSYLLDTLD